MSRKKTIEDFVNDAINIHGDKYDYSKTIYIDSHSKVTIICPIHGEFLQTPDKHLKGQGCPECAKLNRAKSISSNTDEFIKKSNIIHKNKYDYSKTAYINNSTKVCIICREHGEFWQSPFKHLIGQGCPKCAGNEPISTEQFVERSKKIHGDKYDYSKSECNGTHNKTTIICPIHGEFEQMPKEHLKGKGGPLCANESKHEKLKL